MQLGLDTPDRGAAPAGDARLTREPIRRDLDRRITAGGIALSGLFVLAALGSAALPGPARRGAWLPLHLALPGAATTAIGAVLPFFIASLAASRPGRPVLRIATIALLAAGAVAVSVGYDAVGAPLATVGGLLFLAGLGGLALLLVTILGGALGPQRGLIPRAYGWAIVNVVAGATLATLFVSGWPPILEGWANLKPAHAWFNVFGFVGLVIATTLVHLYPTVVGTRIVLRPSVRIALVGLGGGASSVGLGYLLAGLGDAGNDDGALPVLGSLLARAGAGAVLVGAAALVRFLAAVHEARGRWTTDAAWHRFSSWSLALGGAWFVVGVGIAATRVLVLGAAPVSWGVELVGAPLAVGFVLQVLVGSWSHLVPAVGRGDPARHARQRRVLGMAANARLALLNGGAMLLALGLPLASGSTDSAGPGAPPALGSAADGVVAAGAVLAGAALLAALGLLARAMRLGPDPAADPLR